MEIIAEGHGPHAGKTINVTIHKATRQFLKCGDDFKPQDVFYDAWLGWRSPGPGDGVDSYWRIPEAEMRRVRKEYPQLCEGCSIKPGYGVAN